jgi:hypothetical protein
MSRGREGEGREGERETGRGRRHMDDIHKREAARLPQRNQITVEIGYETTNRE